LAQIGGGPLRLRTATWFIGWQRPEREYAAQMESEKQCADHFGNL
jgi:hypothetical protein